MRRATCLGIILIFIGSAVAGDDLILPPPEFGLIVEFRDPPLALLTDRSARAAMVDYEATFKRFREDVTSILSAGVAGKSAAAFEPVIEKKWPRKPLPSGAGLGALTSAKGHPRRVCLGDLSRHSRLLRSVNICDRASDPKRAKSSRK